MASVDPDAASMGWTEVAKKPSEMRRASVPPTRQHGHLPGLGDWQGWERAAWAEE